MFILQANHETLQPAGAPPVCGLSGSSISTFDDGVDSVISLLRELARAQESETREPREAATQQHTCDSSPPIRKLPPSPWRSLGGYFDYSQWSDRERFMELDRAIAAAQRNQLFEFEEPETGPQYSEV